MTYAESKQRRKRKSSEVTQQVPCMIQTKLQRLSNAAAMPSSSSNGYVNTEDVLKIVAS